MLYISYKPKLIGQLKKASFRSLVVVHDYIPATGCKVSPAGSSDCSVDSDDICDLSRVSRSRRSLVSM